jgi:hypothetical protein
MLCIGEKAKGERETYKLLTAEGAKEERVYCGKMRVLYERVKIFPLLTK